MSGQLGDLVVSLSADIARFRGDMGKASKIAQEQASIITKSFEGVQTAVDGLGKGFMLVTGALAGGAMFNDMIETTKEVSGEILSLKRSLGISAEQASVLRIALDDVFLGADDMVAASGKITKQLANNEEAFTNLGVATRDSNGHFRTTTEIMADTNSKLMALKEGTDRNVAGVKIYGKGWEEARKTLLLTAEAMEEGKKRAEELHLIFGDSGLQAVKEYKLAMKDIGDVAESAKVQIGVALIPELTKLASWLADGAAKNMPAYIEALEGIGTMCKWTGTGIATVTGIAISGIIQTWEVARAAHAWMMGEDAEAKRHMAAAKAAGDAYFDEMKKRWADNGPAPAPKRHSVEPATGRVDPDADKKRAELDSARKAAEALRKEWDQVKISLKDDTYALTLSGLDKELAEIGKKADLLRNKKGSYLAKEEIDNWQAEAELAKITADQMEKLAKTVEELDKVQDAYTDAVLDSLPKEQAEVERVTAAYRKKQYAIQDALRWELITKEEAEAGAKGLKINEEMEKYKILAAAEEERFKQDQEWLGEQDQDADQFVKIWDNAVQNIQKSMADFLFDPFKDGLAGMLKGFGTMLQRMVAEAAAADLAKRMFGGKSGEVGGWAGQAAEWLGGLAGSSGGGTAEGMSQVSFFDSLLGNAELAMAGGGVINEPVIGRGVTSGKSYAFGEKEAEVVLNQKQIGGINNSAAGQNITINVNVAGGTPDEVRRSAAQGARSALSALSAAQRFA